MLTHAVPFFSFLKTFFNVAVLFLFVLAVLSLSRPRRPSGPPNLTPRRPNAFLKAPRFPFHHLL